MAKCGYITKDGKDLGHAEPYEDEDEGEDEEGCAEEREERDDNVNGGNEEGEESA